MRRLLVAAVVVGVGLVATDLPGSAFNSDTLFGPIAVVTNVPVPSVPLGAPTTSVAAAPDRAPTTEAPGQTTAGAPAPPPTTFTPPAAPPLAVADADESAFKFAVVHPKTGLPARFNPCQPLHYVVNPTGGPTNAAELTQAAAKKVSDATGITFVFDGISTEPAALPNVGPERPSYQPDRYGPARWAPVLVAWTSFAAGGQQRFAGVSKSPIAEADGHLVKYTGQILLTTDMPLPQELVLLHEFGHLMGLDHVLNPRQIMRAGDLAGDATWGKGDLAGLRQLGRDAGCLSVPPPH